MNNKSADCSVRDRNKKSTFQATYRRPSSGLVVAIVALSTGLCSVHASAQSNTENLENTQAQTEAPTSNNEPDVPLVVPAFIDVSLEDSDRLIGFQQYKNYIDSLRKVGKGARHWITRTDENGQYRKSKADYQFRDLLVEGDPSDAMDALRELNLEFKYPMINQDVHLGEKEDATPNNLLFRAAMVNHMELGRELMDNYDIDVNNVNTALLRDATALHAATASQYADMVDMLLQAGADPNHKPGNVGRALALAVEHKNTRITRSLFQAGASLDEAFGRRGVDKELFNELIEEDNFELVSLLLENGLKVDSRISGDGALVSFTRSTLTLTPLMSALLNGSNQMAMAFLPHSDPRAITQSPVPRERSGIDDIAILPPANALFLAQLRQSELDPGIMVAIEQRIESLGGEEAVLLSRVQAASSTSDLSYLKGDLIQASNILDEAVNTLSIETIKNAQDPTLALTVKKLLAKKHELNVITGTSTSDKDLAFINELAEMGEPVGHWHAMLDTLEQARTGDYEPSLDQWQQQFNGQYSYNWDFSRLNQWIRSLDNEADKDRLFRALDYFEFYVSVLK